MNPNPRQLTLLAVVRSQGSATVEQLANKLGVTLETVRRDVQRLAERLLIDPEHRYHHRGDCPGVASSRGAACHHQQPERGQHPERQPQKRSDCGRGRDAGRDQGIVGEAAVDFIRQFKVAIVLIGLSGIEADGSLRDYDYREVKVSQTILSHAREVWLAADISKFNRPAMVEVGRLSQIDRLFTDAAPPEPFPALLAEAQVRCDVALP